jgi:hypothetical protein
VNLLTLFTLESKIGSTSIVCIGTGMFMICIRSIVEFVFPFLILLAYTFVV